jgi:magnesium transporter
MNAPRPVELFIPEIRLLIQTKQLDGLKELLSEINPIDLADGFTDFPPEQQLLILKLLEPVRQVEVFEELDLPQQEYIISHLEDETLSPLLEGIPSDVTAGLFKKLPARMVKKMAALLKNERMAVVQHVLNFKPHTAGSLMQSGIFPISPDMTARGALERLQACARVRTGGFIHALYVTNPAGKLVGGVTLRTLIGAPADIKIKDIMTPVSSIRILASMDQEEASKIFSRYKLISAPVVDEENQLIGVLTVDDMISVIQQEDTEDIQKQAAVEALDEPYFQIDFFKMVRKRGTWLLVLFLGEMLTATAMGFFEHEIARAVVLALFIPLIISSGGNSGSQAATLIVRAMALKEISFGDWWKVLRREFAAGLVLGSILGLIGFLRIFMWSQFSGIYGEHYLGVAMTVGITLVLVVLWGTLSGSLLPIFLRRLGLDPAVVSTPFVATMVDVTGLVIYFTTALLLLKGTLL